MEKGRNKQKLYLCRLERRFIMLKKNADKLKRKQERETFVGFRPSVMNHAKNYTRKQKHKKNWSED